MRMTESMLEAHLKIHRDRARLARERFKQENQSKVHQAKKQALEVNTELNVNTEIKQTLNCEIASTPPSVNHYWVASGNKRYLSSKAHHFHALVRILVPALMSKARLKLEVIFHFPDNHIRDIDNYKRGNVVKGGLIKLRVWEMYS